MRFRITNGSFRCILDETTYHKTVFTMNAVLGAPFMVNVGECFVLWYGHFQKYIESTDFQKLWSQAQDL